VYVLRLKKLFAAITSRRNRRALLRGVAPSIEHSRSFGSMEYRTVVDIGANKGQFALFARQRFPTARIISFEPLKAAADIYTAIFEDDRLTRLHNVGIGPRDCLVELFVARENDASSLLRPSVTAQAVFGIVVAGTERVRIVPLQSKVSPADIESPALLKLDVQGFELEALKGCADLLPMFDNIYLEMSFIELYESQPLSGAIIDWLNHNGFELCGVFNKVVDAVRGPVQADGLFARMTK
jgi:FkbM family methyltransferase